MLNFAKQLKIIKMKLFHSNKKIKLDFKKLNQTAIIPKYAHDGDLGLDLYAVDVEYDESMDCYIYHTGLSVESKENVGFNIFPRSKNRKTDVYLANSVALVESANYRGEILVCFKPRDSTKKVAEAIYYQKLVEEMLINDANKINAIETAKKTKEDFLDNTRKLQYIPYDLKNAIAQIYPFERKKTTCIEVNKLSDSNRGANGFGSSDKK